jgi:DNA-binding response OmpR family regulator
MASQKIKSDIFLTGSFICKWIIIPRYRARESVWHLPRNWSTSKMGKYLPPARSMKAALFHVIIPLKTQNHEVNGPEKTDLLNVDDIESLSLNIRESSDNAIGEPAGEEVSTILIVEDNEDLREYMNVEFGKKYNLIEAENGKVGLDKAFDIIPDLIISDLIMPEMDGIEFCKEIKKDQRTSHIPIIILTAHGSHFNKVQGYEIGADDYVTKPFSSDLLSLRIENLLKNRKDLQSKFSREVRLQPKDLPISSMDERFLTKAMEVVEENLNNSDFNADSFASEMCMSRVHLYRKLKALTDQSVSDFVKTARLKTCRQSDRKKQAYDQGSCLYGRL